MSALWFAWFIGWGTGIIVGSSKSTGVKISVGIISVLLYVVVLLVARK